MSSPRPAWAGEPPQRGAARERLLDAAGRCIASEGLAALGMASVAAEAGVSRPTVYRYFADREALVEAALFRAGEALLSRMEEDLARLARPDEKAVEAVVYALREIHADPVLREVWTSAADEVSTLERFTSRVPLALCTAALKGLVDAAGWSAAETRESVEVMLRFVLSLLAAPEPRRSERALRAFLQRRMVPALGLSTRTGMDRDRS